jgi:hypothetical protein
MLVKQFDEFGKIRKRAGQPVDFIDDKNVDPAGSDLGEQFLEGRALERRPGKRPIVKPAVYEAPAFMRLALYISLASLPLRLERVEFKIEIMLGRLSRVDRAAKEFCGGRLIHCRPDVRWPELTSGFVLLPCASGSGSLLLRLHSLDGGGPAARRNADRAIWLRFLWIPMDS